MALSNNLKNDILLVCSCNYLLIYRSTILYIYIYIYIYIYVSKIILYYFLYHIY